MFREPREKRYKFLGKPSADDADFLPGNYISQPLPQNAFVSKWMTTTTDEIVELPYNINGNYSGTIYWGDGDFSQNTYENRTHVYQEPGKYQIIIDGITQGFAFNNSGDKNKILEIIQWGDLVGLNNQNTDMFFGCSNMVLTGVTDTPNLSGVTSLESMFEGCTSITTIKNINTWNTSTIENIQKMFFGCSNFNDNINGWDTSNVEYMQNTFESATNFNRNLNNWNTSKVVSMRRMFQSATNFNQNLGNWNIQSINSLIGMLSYCGMSTENYNSCLIGWYSQQPNIPSGIQLDAVGITYSGTSATNAKNDLISIYSWTINDSGQV